MPTFVKSRHLVVALTVLIAGSLEGNDETADAIHARIMTLDSHLDTPSVMARGDFNIEERHDHLRDRSQVDLPRLREGGIDGGFFIVFIPQGPLDSAGFAAAKAHADRLFAEIERLSSEYGHAFTAARKADDAERIVAEGKIVTYIGIENGYPITTIADVDDYFERGARYVSLAHFSNNHIADSATDLDGPRWDGLSPFGENVVRRMNDLGMMIDISHASDDTFWDVIEMTRAPVIASHSGSRAVYDHPRNMRDEMFEAVRENGGVVQINGFTNYLTRVEQAPERLDAMQALQQEFGAWWRLPAAKQAEPRQRMAEINERWPARQAPLSVLADHIDHAVEVMGIDHVGLSMDFDGGGGVDQLSHIGEMQNLTRELHRRGYSEEDLAKFWSGNILRVMRDVEAARTLP